MRDHYKTLGLSPAATAAEIRRAYRILARRYHPDVNPGKSTSDLFRAISEAYEVLSDPARRKAYDQEREVHDTFSSAFDRAHTAYRKQQQAADKGARKPPTSPRPQPAAPKPESPPKRTVVKITPKQSPFVPAELGARILNLASTARAKAESLKKWIDPYAPKREKGQKNRVASISVVEVSISIFEAISGARKTVEIPEPNGESHKVSVSIPAGARQGSIVRATNPTKSSEEVIAVIRVANHPWLAISHRGLTMNVPITVPEAIHGAKIQVPSLGDPLLVTVEPGTQSGKEVRLKGQGVNLADGGRGDLFINFLIQVPGSNDPATLAEPCAALQSLYSGDVRAHLPKKIGEEVAS